MAKLKTNFVCQNCGSISPKWLGRCPECSSWNTYVEEVVESAKDKNSSSSRLTLTEPIFLSDVSGIETSRFETGLGELDLVLGGGIVKGSVVLIGGEPGIGKSTVMLQVAGILSNKEKKTLYVSGEESPEQIKLRAERLNINQKGLELLASTSFEDAERVVKARKYDYIIVDSIQTILSAEINSSPGTVSQVRHVTYKLVEIAKSTGLTVFIVGQVTKDGAIAGPKVLEHLVDTVLYFEGDYTRGVRILRSVKNRFGSTDEVGIFEMSSSGLVEARNRSFIETGGESASGKVLCPVMEGSRAFLVEVQALIAPTFFQFPKRNATGFDNNRLTMLIAILEKKGGLNLSSADVYLNIAGGMKVNEPAADLAVCAAIVSSFKDKPVSFELAFAGEVGLTGEVRSIPSLLSRVSESARFGVKKLIAPIKNEKEGALKYYDVKSVQELVKYLSN